MYNNVLMMAGHRRSKERLMTSCDCYKYDNNEKKTNIKNTRQKKKCKYKRWQPYIFIPHGRSDSISLSMPLRVYKWGSFLPSSIWVIALIGLHRGPLGVWVQLQSLKSEKVPPIPKNPDQWGISSLIFATTGTDFWLHFRSFHFWIASSADCF